MSMENKININNLKELNSFAKNFLTALENKTINCQQATVVALLGDLGAGKTTFVQSVAKELNIEEIVTSPTFTIMKGYKIPTNQFFTRLIHVDAYRFELLEEVKPLKLEEIFVDPKTLVFIEWAEKIRPILPTNTLFLNFKISANEGREITITKEE